MRVDSHQHFWTLIRADYGWLTPDSGAIYRDFLPCDLRPILRNHGIVRTIAVQAAPTVAETRYLLSLAQREELIGGVVGWVDMDAPETAIGDLERFARIRKFRGVRPMIQDIGDVGWMLGSGPATVLERLIALDLRFDALVRPEHLPVLLKLLSRYPELTVVVDHGAKPDIAERRWQPWADRMQALAEDSGAFCKLSGLLTEARLNDEDEVLFPYMNHLFQCFGEKRLMWGSDWPVLNLAGGLGADPVEISGSRRGFSNPTAHGSRDPGSTYGRWHTMVQRWLQDKGSEAARAVEGANAARFYDLDDGISDE